MLYLVNPSKLMKIKKEILFKMGSLGIFYALFIAPLTHFYSDYRIFQINKEGSITEFIEFFVLISIAFFIYSQFYKYTKNKLFLVLSLMFAFMAADDLFGLHETFGSLLAFVEIVKDLSEEYFGTDPRALGELIYFMVVFGIFAISLLNNFHKTNRFEQNFLVAIFSGLIFLFLTGVIYDFLHRTDILNYKFISNSDLVLQDFIEDYLELLTIAYLYLASFFFTETYQKRKYVQKVEQIKPNVRQIP